MFASLCNLLPYVHVMKQSPGLTCISVLSKMSSEGCIQFFFPFVFFFYFSTACFGKGEHESHGSFGSEMLWYTPGPAAFCVWRSTSCPRQKAGSPPYFK